LGHDAQAEDNYVDALRRHELLEAPFFKSRTMLELARLTRRREPARARLADREAA
jgi:hypothetical protein